MEAIKEKLLSACEKNGGYVTDLEIIFIFKDEKNIEKKITLESFIDEFNRLKTEKTGKKSRVKGLSRQSENNLKRLIRCGYTWEDLNNAIEGMYMDGWAENRGMDIPDHLLRNQNFEKYINIRENGKQDHDKRIEAIKRLSGKG